MPGPAGAASDLSVLARLVETAGARRGRAGGLAAVWSEMAAAVPALAGLSFDGIPDSGLPLDGTAWAGTALLVQGEGLHFKPAK